MNRPEEWRPVIGYEESYEVSSQSRIRNSKTGNLLTPSITKKMKYPRVSLMKNKKTNTEYLHRIVANAFVPNPSNKDEVNHKDGDKSNCDIKNLEWVTHKENIHHAFATGLNKGSRGEKGSNAKLSEQEVIEIRYFSKENKKNKKDLAKEYETSVANVYSILYGHSWKHLLGKEDSFEQT